MNLNSLYVQRHIRNMTEGNFFPFNGDGASEPLMEEMRLNEVLLIKWLHCNSLSVAFILPPPSPFFLTHTQESRVMCAAEQEVSKD